MTRRAWVLFVGMCVFWGIPYLLIRVADASLPPVVLVFGRCAVGGLVLIPPAVRGGAFRDLRPRLGWVILLGFFEVVFPFLLIAFGEQRIPSSLSGLLVASLPIMVFLLGLRLDPAERASGIRVLGLLIGLAGVALLLGFDVGGSESELLGAGMVALATLCYAIGVLLIRFKLAGVSQLGVSARTMICACVVLAVPAAILAPHQVPPLPALAAVLVLGVVCTALAFVAYFNLVQIAGPSRAVLITYVNPAVAVLLGIVVLGERANLVTAAGFCLIVLGSWFATRGAAAA